MDWQHCLTTAEIKWLAPLALMADAPFIPAPQEKITGVILALSAALPKQKTDEMRGETMLAVYQRQLRDLTIDELEQAARKCLDELDWFPTIHQIKDRAIGYDGKRLRTADQIAQAKIRALVRNKPKREGIFEESKMLTPSEVAAQEKETARIIAELANKAKAARSPLSA